MRQFFSIICFALMMQVTFSCITNDLSYPDAKVEIIKFDLDGDKDIKIDYETHTISVILEETANIASVGVTEFTLADGASFDSDFPKVLDLTKPYTFKLKVYEDEVWTIMATQPIDRYIRCDGQIGQAIFDLKRKAAYIHIDEKQNLAKVKINEMKLEPEGSVIRFTTGYVPHDGQSQEVTQECHFPMELDCAVSRRFDVVYQGKTIEWLVTFLPTAKGCGSIVLGLQNDADVVTRACGENDIPNYTVKVEGNAPGFPHVSKFGDFKKPFVVPFGTYTVSAENATAVEAETGFGCKRLYATDIVEISQTNMSQAVTLNCVVVNSLVSVVFDPSVTGHIKDLNVALSGGDTPQRVLNIKETDRTKEAWFNPSSVTWTITGTIPATGKNINITGTKILKAKDHLAVKVSLKLDNGMVLGPVLNVGTTLSEITLNESFNPYI